MGKIKIIDTYEYEYGSFGRTLGILIVSPDDCEKAEAIVKFVARFNGTDVTAEIMETKPEDCSDEEWELDKQLGADYYITWYTIEELLRKNQIEYLFIDEPDGFDCVVEW